MTFKRGRFHCLQSLVFLVFFFVLSKSADKKKRIVSYVSVANIVGMSDVHVVELQTFGEWKVMTKHTVRYIL